MVDLDEIYRALGCTRDRGPERIADMLAGLEDGVSGAISCDYSRKIGLALADEIATEVYISSGCGESQETWTWNVDDLRLAFGRVLCRKLGVEA